MAKAPDETLDLFQAVRVLAMHNVRTRPPDYVLRDMQRWYSREFHVPLTEVDLLPLEDLVQAFFETRYEGMDAEARDEETQRLVETRAERLERERKEAEDEASDAAFLKRVREEAKAQAQAPDPARDAAIADMDPVRDQSLTQAPILPAGIKFLFGDSDDEKAEAQKAEAEAKARSPWAVTDD